MKKLVEWQGSVMPLDRANVDTDAIIPKQYLKSIKRSGFGPNLFDDWRYLDPGEPGDDHSKRRLNPEFVMNQSRYEGTSILLARENFGCGSSREHAPWALLDAGFRVLIAPSFAEIFYNNCFKNGILPIVLNEKIVGKLFDEVHSSPGYKLQIDLPNQRINKPDGTVINFQLEEFRKQALLQGLDEIGLTLQKADLIRSYESKRRQQVPWLFSATESDI